MNIDFYGFLRSLSFGGLIGCGLAILIYIFFPEIFVGSLTFALMFIFCGLLGAAAHRGIDSVLVKGILFPISRFTAYYWKLAQVEFLMSRGLIDSKDYLKIKKNLTVEYFLEDKEIIKKSLPPKTKQE